MFKSLLTVPVIATCYAIWPTAIAYTGINSAWGGFIAMFTTTVAVMIWGIVSGNVAITPDSKSVVFMVVAGLINGIGIVYHSKAMSDPEVVKVIFQPSMAVGMVIFSALIAWFVLKEPVSLRQGVWLAAAAFCVVMATTQK